jgi:hypothetical protein
MRRALAMILLAGFSLTLIAPLCASGPSASSLPACCRRNGQHHCAMAGTPETPAHERTIGSRCPFAPPAGLAVVLPHALAAAQRPIATMHAAGPAAVVRDAEAGYRISHDRARSKRGPPSLLSL